MPAKNSQKVYVKNGYYHLYNRGVDKRTLFEDTQDYGVFLSYLKEYLLPKEEETLRKRLADQTTSPQEKDKILKLLRLNNFNDKISLLCYALMPNHFHLLIRQNQENSMDVFMNSLGTRYTMYFNRKYKRVGPLYQGVYKAVLITGEEQLLHLTRYIHQNPLSLQGVALKNLSQQSTSYAEYLDLRKTPWIHTREILSYFSSFNPRFSYRSFVEKVEEIPESIQNLIIEGSS